MILYVMVQFRDHAHMGSVLYESRAHAALLLLTVTVQQMISNDCPSVQETKYKDGALDHAKPSATGRKMGDEIPQRKK